MPAPHALPEGPGFVNVPQRSALPLAGVTLLAVEDSRFASEALRLLCHRSGARLRRAVTLADARRHLAVYRPDVVLVDLGLPDGNGVDLIRELTKTNAGKSVVLAISGDPDGWSAAVLAGAAGFIEKPLESLAAFQQMVLNHLTMQPQDSDLPDRHHIHPDEQALHDDMIHAVEMIERGQAPQERYIADFVRGLARSCHDLALEGAAVQANTSPEAMAGLSRELEQRIKRIRDPFSFSTAKKS